MEPAFISLVLDRKDFEQANTDGHKKQCYNRPVLPSSTKILLRVKVYGNIVIFFLSETLDDNNQTSSIYWCVRVNSSVRT